MADNVTLLPESEWVAFVGKDHVAVSIRENNGYRQWTKVVRAEATTIRLEPDQYERDRWMVGA